MKQSFQSSENKTNGQETQLVKRLWVIHMGGYSLLNRETVGFSFIPLYSAILSTFPLKSVLTDCQ